MRKVIGEANAKARAAAVMALAGFKGKNVKTLTPNEVKDLVAALLQLLGLADQDDNIK